MWRAPERSMCAEHLNEKLPSEGITLPGEGFGKAPPPPRHARGLPRYGGLVLDLSDKDRTWTQALRPNGGRTGARAMQ